MIPTPSIHKRLLTRLTLLLHVVIATLLFAASHLPSFDSSALLVLESNWPTSLLRWDVFHYAHIALNGYVYEYEYAFFPGIPLVMRFGSRALQLIEVPTKGSLTGILLAGMFASTAVAIDAIHTLYDLSMHHFHSPYTALLVSLLSLLSSSPATLRYAPYAEPLFTYLSYKGMLYCARRQFIRASAAFTLSSLFRSNGPMLAGYLIWGMLVEPVLCSSTPRRDIFSGRILRVALGCLLLSVSPALPLIWHQYNGYIAFCDAAADKRRPWCLNMLPMIYSFVQSEYWGIGIFRYWTLQQAPNILLAAPVLFLLVHASVLHIRYAFLPMVRSCLRELRFPSTLFQSKDTTDAGKSATNDSTPDPFLNPSLAPHAIHALILSIILLTSAHTQIALRLVSALPFTYWAAARLFFPQAIPNKMHVGITKEQGNDTCNELRTGKSRWAARRWVGWSIVWGTIALVTWGVFLPPA